MKLVFMGSPIFAVPSLVALKNAGHEIVAVYSQPPRPAGRGGRLTKTPIHQAAEDLGLVVRTPEKLQAVDVDELLALDCEVICVVGYGLLLPKRLVENRICVNVHPSALPRWRGASPVQHAVMFGDLSTEVCIMRLEAGMDSGPVYKRIFVPIGPEMTAGELNDIVWPLGAEGLVEVVENLDKIEPIGQVGTVTLAPKITVEMRQIDFGRTALEVHNQIRGLSPDYGAFFVLNGERLRVFRGKVVDRFGLGLGTIEDTFGTVLEAGPRLVIQCEVGAIELLEIQRPGKRMMLASEALRGWEVGVGARVG